MVLFPCDVLGYESKDNSWELESAFKTGGSKSMMMAFYEKYGWVVKRVFFLFW